MSEFDHHIRAKSEEAGEKLRAFVTKHTGEYEHLGVSLVPEAPVVIPNEEVPGLRGELLFQEAEQFLQQNPEIGTIDLLNGSEKREKQLLDAAALVLLMERAVKGSEGVVVKALADLYLFEAKINRNRAPLDKPLPDFDWFRNHLIEFFKISIKITAEDPTIEIKELRPFLRLEEIRMLIAAKGLANEIIPLKTLRKTERIVNPQSRIDSSRWNLYLSLGL